MSSPPATEIFSALPLLFFRHGKVCAPAHSAAQYLTAHLTPYLFPWLRIVEDHDETEDVLKNSSKGMELPPRDSMQSSSSFWIVVAAVDVVVLMIAAFFYFF